MNSNHLSRTIATIVGCLATAVNATAAEPSFSDCFKLTPGVSYYLEHRTLVQIVDGKFDGKPAIAVINNGRGFKSAEFFDATGRRNLGSEEYGVAAWGKDPNSVVIRKVNVAPVPIFPEHVKVGDSFKLFFKGTTEVTSKKTEKKQGSGNVEYIFVGFENLELGPSYERNSFANACHLRVRQAEGGFGDFWYVPGYGNVKVKVTDKDGKTIVSDELQGLAKR